MLSFAHGLCAFCVLAQKCFSDPCAFAQKASRTTALIKVRCSRVSFVWIVSVSSTKSESILVQWLVFFLLQNPKIFKLPCIFFPKGLTVSFRETSYVTRGKVYPLPVPTWLLVNAKFCGIFLCHFVFWHRKFRTRALLHPKGLTVSFRETSYFPRGKVYPLPVQPWL